MNPSPMDIRQFVLESFDEEAFELFCADYFREVQFDFSPGMSLRMRAQRLVEYCQDRGAVTNLLAALQKERPEAYAKAFPQAAPPAQPDSEPAAGPTTTRDPRQLFISHAHQDAVFAHHLASDLTGAGWSVWIAPDSIHPGEKWVEAIERGLDGSGVFLSIVTPAASASPWMRRETFSAIQLETQGVMRLIPLYVQPSDMPVLLSGYQRVSFVNRYEDGLAELLTTLATLRGLPPGQSVDRPGNVPITPEPVKVREQGNTEPTGVGLPTSEQPAMGETTATWLPLFLKRVREVTTRQWLVGGLVLIILIAVSIGVLSRLSLEANGGSPAAEPTATQEESATAEPSSASTDASVASETPTDGSNASSSAASPLVIYDNGLASGWEDWSYSATVNLNNTTPAHSEGASIAVTPTQGNGGLSLHSPTPLTPHGYTAFTFWVFSPGTERSLGFYTQSDDTGGASIVKEFHVPADGWTQVSISLSELGNPSVIQRFSMEDLSGAVQPAFYVDDIVLE